MSVTTKDAGLANWFEKLDRQVLADFLIVSEIASLGFDIDGSEPISVTVARTALEKCGRCWRHLPEVTEDGALCSRCEQVVAAMDAAV